MKGTKVVVKNTGGVLDLNKLTNVNKPNILEESVKSLRTYVKRANKNNEEITMQTSEHQIDENSSTQIATEIIVPDNIDVENNSAESTTEIINF